MLMNPFPYSATMEMMPALSLPELISILSACFALLAGVIAFLFVREISSKKAAAERSLESVNGQLADAKQELTHLHGHMNDKMTDTFEELIQSAHLGAIILNSAGSIVGINPYAETMSGLKQSDILLTNIQTILTLSDKPETIPALVAETISSMTPKQFKGLMICPSAPLPVTGTLLPYVLHGIKQAVFLFHDGRAETDDTLQNQIASLEHTVETIKKTESLTEDIVSEGPIGCVVIDKDDTMIFANKKAETILGLADKQTYAGKSYKEIIKLMEENGTHRYDLEKGITEKNVGIPHWTFLVTPHGPIPIIGTVSHIQDNRTLLLFIDAQHQYEKESDEHAFFSSAAHDLRTPLTAIRGFLELTSAGIGKEPNEKIRGMIDDAHTSVINLIGLVNDILSVSRIDTGRIEITREAFNIQHVAKEVIEESKILAENKHLMLDETIGEVNVPKVLGDKKKTKEIIQNLVSNAIKYTQQGGVSISYRIDGPHVLTSVTDTGMGISEQNKRLLFRKFQQVGFSRTQPVARSTGLGLYIAKTLAAMMNGDVFLETSEPGAGSTFILSLPIAVNPQESSSPVS